MLNKTKIRGLSKGIVVMLVLALFAGYSFGQNLVVSGSGTFSGNGVINIKGSINTSGASGPVTISGTVNLNGDNLQRLGVSGSNAIQFNTLQALGSSIKQMDVNVTADALQINNGNYFDVMGKSLTVNTATITNGIIRVNGGSAAFNGVPSIATNGSVVAEAGMLDFNANVDNSGTISLSGNAVANFAGNFVKVGTLSFGNASTVVFDGGAQTIPAVNYGNLTLSGTAGKTGSTGSITLAGNLTLNQNLDVYTNGGTVVFSAPGSVSGAGEVIGAVQRTHTFAAATPYAFNRAEVTLQFASAEEEDVTITMRPGVAPSGVGTSYVNRYYGVSSNANLALNNANLQLYYLNSELVNISNEDKLGFSKYSGGTLSKLGTNGGSYTRNVSSDPNTIALTNINQGLSGITEFAITPIGYVTIANGAWNAVATWGSTPDDIPGATDDAEVRHNVTMGGGNRQIANLTITHDATYNGVLNVDDGNFTVTGALNSTGAINVSASRTLQVNGALTLSGNMLVNGIANLTSVTNNGSFMIDGAGAQANLTGQFTNNSNLTTQNGGLLKITGADLVNSGAITNNGTITLE